MSDAVDRGITVTELAPMDRPIDASRETSAAFVGRALRGPLNTPVLVESLAGFRRRFGNIWSRSSLGPAVRQFFEHGGRNLYVVRVANNARGALLCLPASGSALVLRAIEPGSTERIRAAVDYDGIDADNDELFNLTVQRTDPTTGLVSDQELYRRTSFREGSDNFIGDALLASSLARVEKPLPTHRPEVTYGPHTLFDLAYAGHVQDGTDGYSLSDYDLVGSRKAETGLFALQQVERFDLLYLPAPGKGRDPGPTAILAAERYCREHGAMLVVDPSPDWRSQGAAVRGVRDLGYASPNLVCYFPRMRHRHDTDTPPRAIGGAIAGLLCKLDHKYGVWHGLDHEGIGLRRDLVPAVELSKVDAGRLNRAGVNAIMAGPAGSARIVGDVTMGRGSASQPEFRNLPVRRLCLRIISAIRDATRWAVFEQDQTNLGVRIESQVDAYLAALANEGAFGSDHYVVRCDAGSSSRREGVPDGVTILISFRPRGCGKAIYITLQQTIAGCRIASTAFAPVDSG